MHAADDVMHVPVWPNNFSFFTHVHVQYVPKKSVITFSSTTGTSMVLLTVLLSSIVYSTCNTHKESSQLWSSCTHKLTSGFVDRCLYCRCTTVLHFIFIPQLYKTIRDLSYVHCMYVALSKYRQRSRSLLQREHPYIYNLAAVLLTNASTVAVPRTKLSLCFTSSKETSLQNHHRPRVQPYNNCVGMHK